MKSKMKLNFVEILKKIKFPVKGILQKKFCKRNILKIFCKRNFVKKIYKKIVLNFFLNDNFSIKRKLSNIF